MEKGKIEKCSNHNMDRPRTEEEWKAYKEIQRNSERPYINENGERVAEVTEYA